MKHEIKIGCTMCNFKVEMELKEDAYLSPEDMKNMADFLGLIPTPTGYICKDCFEKRTNKEKQNASKNNM